MNRTLLGLLTLALLAAPAASAATSVTFADELMTIPANGSATLDVSVTVDCSDLIPSGASVGLSVGGLPDYFGAQGESLSFALTDCSPPASTATKDATITFTPTADAVGFEAYAFTVDASTGESFDHTKQWQVGYASGHTIITDLAFPYVFTNADDGMVTWNITIDVTANSQTMVMFQNLQASVGKLSGVSHQIFDVETGDTTRTLTATFEAPDFEWDNATIQFWNYSHCLKGADCPPTNSQNITWVIENQSTRGGGGGDGGDKDSPGLAPIGLTLALVAAALVARRRA